MTTDPNDLDRRRGLHAMWSAVAPNWERHADHVDARSEGLTERMVAGVALRPGDRVLELACGPGGTGLAAAPAVAPGGEVVLSDVAPEMVAVAAARAAERGLTEVRTRTLDLEAIDEPDASFDAVLCREGLMFATDPARAAREIRRVLRPGGRVAVATWGARERNPWLGRVLDAASAQLGVPLPPPGVPGPFSLSDPAELGALLEAAGLTDVDVTEVRVAHEAGSFDEWWARTTALAGPLAGLLAGLPADAADEMRSRAAASVQEFATADGFHFPGVSLLATARAR